MPYRKIPQINAAFKINKTEKKGVHKAVSYYGISHKLISTNLFCLTFLGETKLPMALNTKVCQFVFCYFLSVFHVARISPFSLGK